MVKVRYSEGVAIHTDPESCAGHCREAVREALIGGRTGEVLSGESNVVRGADAVVACRRQQARVRHREDLGHPASSLDPEHVRSEEHTSELQSHLNIVCRLLLEKKKKI